MWLVCALIDGALPLIRIYCGTYRQSQAFGDFVVVLRREYFTRLHRHRNSFRLWQYSKSINLQDNSSLAASIQFALTARLLG